MYLVRVTPRMNFTFSDDSLFLKKILGGGHKFSEFACYYCLFCVEHVSASVRDWDRVISGFMR